MHLTYSRTCPHFSSGTRSLSFYPCVGSLFALWVSDLPGTHQMSFGYHRAEILGALISVLLIWALTFYLVVEAFDRLRRPEPVNGSVMFITVGWASGSNFSYWQAFVGTIANIFMTYILGVHRYVECLMIHSSISHGIGSTHTHSDDEPCNGHHHHHHEHQPEEAISKPRIVAPDDNPRIEVSANSSSLDIEVAPFRFVLFCRDCDSLLLQHQIWRNRLSLLMIGDKKMLI